MEEIMKTGRAEFIPACRALDDERFSPWILQAAFKGIPGEVMARMLDDAGIAVSTGSACHNNRSGEGRPVLAAMGVDKDRAFEGIRISQGWTTTDEDCEALVAAIKGILAKV
jgi:cysteine desulfurase